MSIMRDENSKYTAVDDEFLQEVLNIIEERDLFTDLDEEERDLFRVYKELINRE